jgi:hypothetical protein
MIEYFTKPGEWVCDPFSSSGVVPLEALLLGRKAAANDLNAYAYCITQGKAQAPASYTDAAQRAEKLLSYVERHRGEQDLRKVDKWVRSFFHPRTLKEVLAAFRYCRRNRDWFLAACLCGILHHQRPGFLSYPASHLVPYLRPRLFPRRDFPQLYEYRPLAHRIIAKIERAYTRPNITKQWKDTEYIIKKCDARALPFDNSVRLQRKWDRRVRFVKLRFLLPGSPPNPH